MDLENYKITCEQKAAGLRAEAEFHDTQAQWAAGTLKDTVVANLNTEVSQATTTIGDLEAALDSLVIERDAKDGIILSLQEELRIANARIFELENPPIP